MSSFEEIARELSAEPESDDEVILVPIFLSCVDSETGVEYGNVFYVPHGREDLYDIMMATAEFLGFEPDEPYDHGLYVLCDSLWWGDAVLQ